MKLLIAGSRTIDQFDLSQYITKDVDLIISGGACGIDLLAEKYADDHRISKLIMRPKYHVYGKAAPILRNHEMVDLADRVLVVWDGVSRGTKDTIAYAKQQQKEIEVVIYTAPKTGK